MPQTSLGKINIPGDFAVFASSIDQDGQIAPAARFLYNPDGRSEESPENENVFRVYELATAKAQRRIAAYMLPGSSSLSKRGYYYWQGFSNEHAQHGLDEDQSAALRGILEDPSSLPEDDPFRPFLMFLNGVPSEECGFKEDCKHTLLWLLNHKVGPKAPCLSDVFGEETPSREVLDQFALEALQLGLLSAYLYLSTKGKSLRDAVCVFKEIVYALPNSTAGKAIFTALVRDISVRWPEEGMAHLSESFPPHFADSFRALEATPSVSPIPSTTPDYSRSLSYNFTLKEGIALLEVDDSNLAGWIQAMRKEYSAKETLRLFVELTGLSPEELIHAHKLRALLLQAYFESQWRLPRNLLARILFSLIFFPLLIAFLVYKVVYGYVTSIQVAAPEGAQPLTFSFEPDQPSLINISATDQHPAQVRILGLDEDKVHAFSEALRT